MSEPVPKDNYRLLKRVTGIGVLGIAMVWALGFYWFGWPIYQHSRHVVATRQTFRDYSPEQWKRVYDGVAGVVGKHPGLESFPEPLWPVEVAALAPYNMGYKDGEVWMNWTGGFDDDNLYMHVVLLAGQHERGIYLNDGQHEGDGDWYVYRPPSGSP